MDFSFKKLHPNSGSRLYTQYKVNQKRESLITETMDAELLYTYMSHENVFAPFYLVKDGA